MKWKGLELRKVENEELGDKPKYSGAAQSASSPEGLCLGAEVGTVLIRPHTLQYFLQTLVITALFRNKPQSHVRIIY